MKHLFATLFFVNVGALLLMWSSTKPAAHTTASVEPKLTAQDTASAPIPPVPQSPAAPKPSYTLPLTYNEGDRISWKEGFVERVVEATYGGGEEKEHPCDGFCEPKDRLCTEFAPIEGRPSVKNFSGLVVGKGTLLGKGPCPGNEQVLKLVVETRHRVPLYKGSECNNNSIAVTTGIGPNGFQPVCHCRPAFTGPQCGKCFPGLVDYPRCVARPFLFDIQDTPAKGNCPRLVERKCNLSKFPRALHHLKANQSYLNVLGCKISALPFGCQLGTPLSDPSAPKPSIKSLCTILAGNTAGAHLMLLFESVRIFAPTVPFVIGIDKDQEDEVRPALEKLQGKGAVIEMMVVTTSSLSSWDHEKPLLMQRVLERYENTLWIDTDAVLIAELPTPPASAVGMLGVAMHDPRGLLPHNNHVHGFTNTGVIYATRGVLDHWVAAMKRFDRRDAGKEEWQGMPELFLDQGPMDYVMTTAPGAFKLDPQWNLGWWLADKTIPTRGANGSSEAGRIAMSSEGRITLDNSTAYIAHSHFIAQEKNYGDADKVFNTQIRDLLDKAPAGSLLSKLAPRFKLYATHVNNASSTAVNTSGIKAIESFKND